MSLCFETFICQKCGRAFTAAAGGVVMSPKEEKLRTYPVCDPCKLHAFVSIFKPKNK